MRTVELTIEDVAFGGKGVARDEGKAVFIPFTIDGERIAAKIVREKRQFANAELVDVIEKSSHRVEPACPYFGRCGGCAYQHISYEHQLDIKTRQVRDVLRRIGKIENAPVLPMVPSPLAYSYRNRITVHVQDGIVGFYQRDSNRLIDIEQCPISSPGVNDALVDLRAQKPRDGNYTLRAGGGPLVFTQISDEVARALADRIAQFIPKNQQLLIDAYCGAGFFAKRLAERFKRVIGIDWDRFAIRAAQQHATVKETYIAGDVEDELHNVLVGAVDSTDPSRIGIDGRLGSIAPTSRTVLIVDPPATGLPEGVRAKIVDVAPQTVIYVSCNPATLARDLLDLTKRYAVESVTPFDMFPQTAEIEVAVHLTCR